MIRIFTLKFKDSVESFDDSVITDFFSDKEIKKWEAHFFERKAGNYWTIVVEYESLISQSNVIPSKKNVKKNEGYKELLKEQDWPLFNRLRDWRGEKGKSDGVPPYIIFTNLQLGQLTVKKPLSLNAFQEIEGVGDVKKKKYGNEIIQIIKSHAGDKEKEE
jgi:superfamily II DNA helicase RecQ